MENTFKLTPAIIGAIAEAYKSGKTTTELAKEYNLTKATICKALRRVGIEPVRKDNLFVTKVLTEEQIQAIINDFNAGLKVKNIAKKYDFSYEVVYGLLEKQGLIEKETRVPSETKEVAVGDKLRRILGEEDQAEMCRKYIETSATKQDLSEEYVVHIDTVSAILRRRKAVVKRYIPEEIKSQILEEYKVGKTPVSDLAKLYKLSPETVRFWLVKEGLIQRDSIATPKVLDSKSVRDLFRDNMDVAIRVLDDIIQDESIPARDRIQAIKLKRESGYGKPREEDGEEGENKDSTSKILEMIGKKK